MEFAVDPALPAGSSGPRGGVPGDRAFLAPERAGRTIGPTVCGDDRTPLSPGFD